MSGHRKTHKSGDWKEFQTANFLGNAGVALASGSFQGVRHWINIPIIGSFYTALLLCHCVRMNRFLHRVVDAKQVNLENWSRHIRRTKALAASRCTQNTDVVWEWNHWSVLMRTTSDVLHLLTHGYRKVQGGDSHYMQYILGCMNKLKQKRQDTPLLWFFFLSRKFGISGSKKINSPRDNL